MPLPLGVSQLAVVPDGRFMAVHSSGPRLAKDVRHIVIHCTQSGSAEGSARWFTSRLSGGSTQLVLDDKETFRTLGDLVVPWGAPPLNRSGLHIEQAGYVSWSRARWLLHLPTIQRAAWHTSRWCRKYGVPVIWLTPEDLLVGRAGITSHANVSLAFGESNHTDPGKGYPVSTFMWFVRRYLKVAA